MSESDTITRNAKSNLAFTLVNLPEATRRHMAQFYAFCRIVDDIVDEPGMTPQERHAALDRWQGIITGAEAPHAGIEAEVRGLMDELKLDPQPMMELIDGCRSDIEPQQPRTREELLEYCYKVAACVGITSAQVMGADEEAHDYAVSLGYALQMVNILRDMAEDCHRHGRFYIPLADMELFGVTHDDIRQEHYNYRMRQLLAYEAALAEKFFYESDDLYQQMSVANRNALVPAQAMKLIYRTILEKMQADEYRVFERRYSVNNFRKLWFMLRARIGTVELPNLPGLSEWNFLKPGDEEEDE